MKVLLVRPPYHRLRGYRPSAYFPLGAGYIAAVLEKAGHAVKVWNADATVGITAGVMPDEVTMLKERAKKFKEYQDSLHNDSHPVWQEAIAVLKDFDPDVVGFTVLTPEAGSASCPRRSIGGRSGSGQCIISTESSHQRSLRKRWWAERSGSSTTSARQG